MRVVVLGSGPNQSLGIARLKELGHIVIACDYAVNSVGKSIADCAALADVFSYSEIVAVAEQYAADAIVVFATDQPVMTAAQVSQALRLPYHLTVEQAGLFTDKLKMKALFKVNQLAITDYLAVDRNTSREAICQLLPGVIKPADSQGQRGISLVESYDDFLAKLPLAMAESRTDAALIERYYPNREVTVSGWVKANEVYILTMTDRVTFESTDKLGVCISHEHPSLLIDNYGAEIERLTHQISQLTEIENGPIYYQFLIGENGVVVNEIASRIGGAHEDVFIKYLTGFDVLEAQINLTTGCDVDVSMLEDYSFRHNKKPLSVQLFFANPGVIDRVELPQSHDWLLKFGLHFEVGDAIPETHNASARCGYAVIAGNSEVQLNRHIKDFYRELKVLNQAGVSLVIEGKRGYR